MRRRIAANGEDCASPIVTVTAVRDDVRLLVAARAQMMRARRAFVRIRDAADAGGGILFAQTDVASTT